VNDDVNAKQDISEARVALVSDKNFAQQEQHVAIMSTGMHAVVPVWSQPVRTKTHEVLTLKPPKFVLKSVNHDVNVWPVMSAI
jgi:hypothetical protein